MKRIPRQLIQVFKDLPEGKPLTIVLLTHDGIEWDIKTTRTRKVKPSESDMIDLETIDKPRAGPQR